MVFPRKTKDKICNLWFVPRKTKEEIRNLWFSQGKPKKRYCIGRGLDGFFDLLARRLARANPCLRETSGRSGNSRTRSDRQPLRKKSPRASENSWRRACQPSQGMSHRARDSRTRTDPQTLRRNNKHASENSRRKARQPSRGTLGRQRNS